MSKSKTEYRMINPRELCQSRKTISQPTESFSDQLQLPLTDSSLELAHEAAVRQRWFAKHNVTGELAENCFRLAWDLASQDESVAEEHFRSLISLILF